VFGIPGFAKISHSMIVCFGVLLRNVDVFDKLFKAALKPEPQEGCLGCKKMITFVMNCWLASNDCPVGCWCCQSGKLKESGSW